jgi:type IV secretion system protein VirB3
MTAGGERRGVGLKSDVLFVGATRPPTRWGVTYSALLFNLVFTMEAFLATRNLLTLLVALPIQGTCMLLCARDPRFFDLVLLWGRTRFPALLGNLLFWKASAYSPLVVDLPGANGTRKSRAVNVYVAARLKRGGPC